MRNLLCVSPRDRDWIRLRHYEGLDFEKVVRDGVAGAGGVSVEGVGELWGRVRASQRLNLMLRAEKAKNAALLRVLRRVLGEGEQQDGGGRAPLGFLKELGSLTEGATKAPIETTTAFALSQLQALRSLSTSLNNMAPDLAALESEREAPDDGAGRKSWRRERVEYVEGQARKHLEDARGLELGAQGAVRDGEWQGEGRKFSRSEVQALEAVSEALGEKGDPMDES